MLGGGFRASQRVGADAPWLRGLNGLENGLTLAVKKFRAQFNGLCAPSDGMNASA